MAEPVVIKAEDGDTVVIEVAKSGRAIWLDINDVIFCNTSGVPLKRNELLQLILALQTIACYKEIDV